MSRWTLFSIDGVESSEISGVWGLDDCWLAADDEDLSLKTTEVVPSECLSTSCFNTFRRYFALAFWNQTWKLKDSKYYDQQIDLSEKDPYFYWMKIVPGTPRGASTPSMRWSHRRVRSSNLYELYIYITTSFPCRYRRRYPGTKRARMRMNSECVCAVHESKIRVITNYEYKHYCEWLSLDCHAYPSRSIRAPLCSAVSLAGMYRLRVTGEVGSCRRV